MDESPTTELARLTALHRAGIAVVRQRDVTDVMTTVIEELAHTLGYHYVSAYLWDAPVLRLQAQQGYVTPVVEGPPTYGVVGRVFRTGESALITDPATDPDFFFADPAVQSQIAVPIFDGARCCGVMSVESAGLLDVRDHELLELFAQQIGVAITTARLHAALVHAAWTDPLTGVLNRAALLIGIEGAIAEAAGDGRTLTVLFVDIDHFKTLNDHHGHQLGDRVLQRCAAQMQALLPDGGLLGRYGGEEFVVLIPDPTGEVGAVLAEQLRAAIAANMPGDERTDVTVSIGIAHYPGDGEEMEALLRAADQALYQAKAAGRNRVR